MLAGDPAAAERELRRDFDALTAMGERYVLSTIAAELARAIEAQGRHEEALGLTRVAEDLSAEDDITSQALWRVVRGKILARRGQPGEALALASAGLQLLRRTDASVVRDEGLVEVADVMHLCGDPDGAAELLHEALGLLERKGNVAKAATVRSALEMLKRSTIGVGSGSVSPASASTVARSDRASAASAYPPSRQTSTGAESSAARSRTLAAIDVYPASSTRQSASGSSRWASKPAETATRPGR